MRQSRCSGSGTKLKNNSSAANRFTSRLASAQSDLRPLGARLDCAWARCKVKCGSHSLHTGRQYWAVLSMTTSVTSACWRTIRNRSNSACPVPNLPFCKTSSGLAASAITTIRTCLCTSIPAIFFMLTSLCGTEGRMHERVVKHHLVLPSLLRRAGIAHMYRFQRHSRPGLLTASTTPKLPRPCLLPCRPASLRYFH